MRPSRLRGRWCLERKGRRTHGPRHAQTAQERFRAIADICEAQGGFPGSLPCVSRRPRPGRCSARAKTERHETAQDPTTRMKKPNSARPAFAQIPQPALDLLCLGAKAPSAREGSLLSKLLEWRKP